MGPQGIAFDRNGNINIQDAILSGSRPVARMIVIGFDLIPLLVELDKCL
jgi:hypothetical protein